MILNKDKKMIGVFEPIDWETPEEAKYLDELDVEGIAERNGKKNLPFSSDKSPDSAELTIKGAIEKKIHQASLSAQKAYDAVASSIESISIEAEASLLLQLPDSFEKESAVELTAYKTEHSQAKSEVDRLETDFEQFKRQNNLRREADYPESKWLVYGIAAFIVLGETCLNAMFFAEGNDLGLFGGAGQALVASLINLVIGWLVGGMCLRYLNHVDKVKKVAAGVGGTVLICLALAWNLLVGQYRTALSIDPDNANALAVERFIESPFALSQTASWMLFGIGLLLTTIVIIDAYKSDDAYPKFGKIDRKLRDAIDDLAEVLNEWHRSMNELHAEYLEKVDENFHICQERADRLERSHRTIKQQISILDRFVAAHKQVFESCVLTYRQINKQNREDEAPSYFDLGPQSEFSHDFHPDAVEDKRSVVRQRRDEIANRLPEIKNQLLQIYKEKVEEL